MKATRSLALEYNDFEEFKRIALLRGSNPSRVMNDLMIAYIEKHRAEHYPERIVCGTCGQEYANKFGRCPKCNVAVG